MKRAQNLFQDVGGNFLKISGCKREARKLMTLLQNPDITTIFKFSFGYFLCRVMSYIDVWFA